MPITEARLKKIALSFPGANESSSYGQPAFKIEKTFFTRLRREDDSIVLIVDSIDERDMMLEADPKTFFITDHYKNHPTVLVRIARIDAETLRAMLERRWRAIAPKKAMKGPPPSAAPPCKTAKPKRKAWRMALTKAQARKIALSFPGAYEKSSYGDPAIFVGKTLFTQVGSHKREAIMLLTQTLEERDHLVAADPDTFYITDHFKNYKGLLAHIGKLDAKTFRALLERRWRATAPKAPIKKINGKTAKAARPVHVAHPSTGSG